MNQKSYISRMWRRAALVTACACFSVSSFAAEPYPIGGQLKANTEYTLGNDPAGWAEFIPDSDGTIIYNCYTVIRPYSEKDMEMELESKYLGYMDGQQKASIEVSKGVTVYFATPETVWYFNPGYPFIISQNQPVELLGYSLSPGEIMSLTSGYDTLEIMFNQPVHAESVVLSIDGTSISKTIVTSSDDMTTISINYTTTVDQWIKSGTIKGGETLTLTLSGIKNSGGVTYNDGEDIVLKYEAPVKPVNLLSSVEPDPFISYWKSGDESAVLTATYSGHVSRAEYLMTYGEFEKEVPDGYVEEGSSEDRNSPAKVTIEGNTVKIDFSGKQRRPKDMVPSGSYYNNLYIKVYAWDDSGQPVVSDGQGQLGSFGRELNYQYIPPADLNITFTPEPGSSLKGESQMVIHLYDYEKIKFTGVKFETEEGQTYITPYSQVSEKGGPEFDWYLTIPIPEEIRNTDSKVTVTFDGLTSTDGENHANEIRAVYNGYTLTDFLVYDLAGQLTTSRRITQLAAGSKIAVVPNVAQAYPDLYIEYEVADIYNDVPTIIRTATSMTRKVGDSGKIIYEIAIPETIKMVRDHEYRFIFSAWISESDKLKAMEPLGVEYYEFIGTGEPFRFSSIQFVSVDPADGTEIKSAHDQFTLVYDGLVTLSSTTSFINLDSGNHVNFASITPVEPESGFANTWILTLPSGYIASNDLKELHLTVVAKGEDGLIVEGNEGNEEKNIMHLFYPVEAEINTAIYTIFGDDEQIDVYTADGRHIVKKGSSADMRSLTPGFYVINGKKVILK